MALPLLSVTSVVEVISLGTRCSSQRSYHKAFRGSQRFGQSTYVRSIILGKPLP